MSPWERGKHASSMERLSGLRVRGRCSGAGQERVVLVLPNTKHKRAVSEMERT
jgi:hypothetical protein